jgi:hypothetical protein
MDTHFTLSQLRSLHPQINFTLLDGKLSFPFKEDPCIAIVDPLMNENATEVVDPSYHELSMSAVVLMLLHNSDGQQDIYLPPIKSMLELLQQLLYISAAFPLMMGYRPEIKQADGERSWWNVQLRVSFEHKQLILESTT